MHRAGAGDGSAGCQGHGASGIERTQAECIDIAHHHTGGVADRQRSAEVIGPGQADRVGQGERDDRYTGIARACIQEGGNRVAAGIKPQIDRGARATGRRRHADGDAIGVGCGQPVRTQSRRR